MKFIKILVIAAAMACIPLVASAQTSVVFTNNDGTFAYDLNPGDATYNELSLGTIGNGLGSSSELTAISGLTDFGIPNSAVAFPCSPNCLGTVTLVTGQVTSGSVTSQQPGHAAQFAPGGNFTAHYNNGVIFSGSFSSASWTSSGVGTNTWNFFGTIMNGTLTIDGNNYTINTAVTVQLTVTGTPAVFHPNKNTYTFSDSGGTTNFSVAPEPGTLALFGSGLIAVGLVTRRRLGTKA
jgi:hypothetical protein